MSTNKDVDPTRISLRRPADRAGQGVETASSEAVAMSPVLKAGILVAVIAASGIAVLAIGNPVTLLAGVSASLVGDPPSTPAVQSAAEAPASSAAVAEDVTPTTQSEPANNEVAASEPSGSDQPESREPSSEALFAAFQAWAAEQDEQRRREPVQAVQDPPAQVEQKIPAPAAENVRPPQRPAQKRRPVGPPKNARAEVRKKNLQKQARRPQAARSPQPSRVQDARAQDTAPQEAPAPSFLPFFSRN